MKYTYHDWCNSVRYASPGDRAELITLAEFELRRHDTVAKSYQKPGKDHVHRSFYDVVGGMRQIGKDVYDLYDDFTPHVLNEAERFFLFPTVMEGCQRYGRTWVKEAPSIGTIPPPRTPQDWKWGPQDVLLTPIGKTITRMGSAFRNTGPGEYVVEVMRGRGKQKAMFRLMTVNTRMSNDAFRTHVSSVGGKIDVIRKVQGGGGAFGMTVMI